MFVTFLCSNTQKLSQNCFFSMFMSERTIKLNMREGGGGTAVSVTEKKTVSSFELKSEMKAHIVKRQDIHHLTVDLKTLKESSSELLSSLLRQKAPNCLRSLTAQHTHVKKNVHLDLNIRQATPLLFFTKRLLPVTVAFTDRHLSTASYFSNL